MVTGCGRFNVIKFMSILTDELLEFDSFMVSFWWFRHGCGLETVSTVVASSDHGLNTWAFGCTHCGIAVATLMLSKWWRMLARALSTPCMRFSRFWIWLRFSHGISSWTTSKSSGSSSSRSHTVASIWFLAMGLALALGIGPLLMEAIGVWLTWRIFSTSFRLVKGTAAPVISARSTFSSTNFRKITCSALVELANRLTNQLTHVCSFCQTSSNVFPWCALPKLISFSHQVLQGEVWEIRLALQEWDLHLLKSLTEVGHGGLWGSHENSQAGSWAYLCLELPNHACSCHTVVEDYVDLDLGTWAGRVLTSLGHSASFWLVCSGPDSVHQWSDVFRLRRIVSGPVVVGLDHLNRGETNPCWSMSGKNFDWAFSNATSAIQCQSWLLTFSAGCSTAAREWIRGPLQFSKAGHVWESQWLVCFAMCHDCQNETWHDKDTWWSGYGCSAASVLTILKLSYSLWPS